VRTTIETTRVPQDGRRRHLTVVAAAALLLAALPITGASGTDPCTVSGLALRYSGSADDANTFTQGSTITIIDLTATYDGSEGCAVPGGQRFVIDGFLPGDPFPGPATAGELVGLALFEQFTTAVESPTKEDVVIDPDFLTALGRTTSDAANLDGRVFTSLANFDLDIRDDAEPGDYVLRFFLVTVSGTTFTPVVAPIVFEFTISTVPSRTTTPDARPAPATAPVTQPAGGAQFVDASGTPVATTVSVTDGVMTVTAGGFSVATTGDLGATVTSGPVALPSGTLSTTITGAIPAGSVVEVRMFSTPRLVAAARSDGSGTLTIDLPLGEPLDGGEPIPAGTHTMQLLIPTSSGPVAMNVGVTVGGPVPTRVPAGQGQAPLAPFALTSLLALGAAVAIGRRTRLTPTV